MKLPKPDQRGPLLAALQEQKMGGSAHGFVRGSTRQFYRWLAAGGTKIPEGPSVWVCGDCHIGNLGPVASVKGAIAIQIRDLDQTVLGNPVHDVIRLALSLASAARGANLPGATTARVLEQMVEGYQSGLVADRSPAPEEQPQAVRSALRSALKRSWRQLAKDRIDGPSPAIPLGKRFWPLSVEERQAIEVLVASNKIRALITRLHSRDVDARIEVKDAAFWVKGCSSLGGLRYAVLVEVSDGDDRQLTLIDIKEAVRPLAPKSPGAKTPSDNGERVVTGARHLSPYLGERMEPAELLGRSVFVRELLPQDLKLDMEILPVEEAALAARFLAQVVGRAHGRQLDEDARERWSAELTRQRPRGLDAPSWLWSSVVELLGAHEVAYLEHCRRCAQVAA